MGDSNNGQNVHPVKQLRVSSLKNNGMNVKQLLAAAYERSKLPVPADQQQQQQGPTWMILKGDDNAKLTNEDLNKLCSISSLVELDLSNNNITDIPKNVAQSLQNLEKLVLNSNDMEQAPKSIEMLVYLESLHLRLNRIKSWPTCVNGLQNLTTLDLGFNQLTTVDFAPPAYKAKKLFNFKSLLSSNSEDLDKIEGLQQRLTYLDLSFNNITKFPHKILEFRALKYLNLSSNELGTLPPEIGYFPHLRELRLNNIGLTKVPPALTQLDELRVLDLGSNNIVEIPKELLFCYLPFLQEVLLEKCGIRDLSSLNTLAKCKKININNNKVTVLTEEFCNAMYFLEELHMRGNQLQLLPSYVSSLKALRVLDVSKNEITSIVSTNIDAGLSQMAALEELYLGDNQLESIPNLSRLTRLTRLDASNNKLGELPGGLSPTLKYLNMQQNKIKGLPDEFYRLTALQDLILNVNYIPELSSKVTQMTSLRTINLDNNELDELPLDEMKQKMPLLRLITVKHNSPAMYELVQDFHKRHGIEMDDSSPMGINRNNNNNISSSSSITSYNGIGIGIGTGSSSSYLLSSSSSNNNNNNSGEAALPDQLMVYGHFDKPDAVMKGLYIGSEVAARCRKVLMRLGITHVLVVGKDLAMPHPDYFTYKNIAVLDTKNADLKSHFAECFAFIDEAISNGGGCLVHCQAGVSRSATVVTAYLMKTKMVTAKQALMHLCKQRPIVSPNIGFLRQLEEFDRELAPLRLKHREMRDSSPRGSPKSPGTSIGSPPSPSPLTTASFLMNGGESSPGRTRRRDGSGLHTPGGQIDFDKILREEEQQQQQQQQQQFSTSPLPPPPPPIKAAAAVAAVAGSDNNNNNNINNGHHIF